MAAAEMTTGMAGRQKERTLVDTCRDRISRAAWSTSGADYWLVACLVLSANAALLVAIVYRIPFTEIDYQTYLQQAHLFLKGERQYDRISGDSGPCVYPAVHLYIYSVFSWLSDAGARLRPAQLAYAALYIFNQILTVLIYRAARVPAFVLPFLLLSKRLPSIYVLRMFNDCWAATLMNACILSLCWRTPRWTLASTLFSLAMGIKMNVLLYVPAFASVYIGLLGLPGSVWEALNVVLIQVLVGSPFLLHDWRAYLASAFDFSRQFLYVWTVNWRFVDEETFLGKPFARSLLVVHASLALLWLTFRWTTLGQVGLLRWSKQSLSSVRTVSHLPAPTARYIVVALATCNLIGITFARSLHYQFYSWYAQHIPLLVYVAKLPLPVKLVLPLVIEWTWNVFPSTTASSASLFACHLLLLVGLWRAKQDAFRRPQGERKVR